MSGKKPLTDKALNQLFREARTYNGYTEKPVSKAQMDSIWDLMKYGPTSANCLPARMIWCHSQASKEKLASLTMPSNAQKIMNAPVSVIIGMDMDCWFKDAPELSAATAFRNSSLQGAYFIMAARALGLDTGPMSGFDNDAVDQAFFAATPIRSNFISTLGYGDDKSILERSPRPAFDRFNTIV